MPYLGDYLGQLLSEITIARLQADLETVRLAELYAAHPLLRTMPVPHVRLPEVDLDLPVLIEASEEPRDGESARGGPTFSDLNKKFQEVLTANLGRNGVQLTADQKKRVKTALDERANALRMPPEVAVDVHRVADDLSSTAVKTIADIRTDAGDPALPDSVFSELHETARMESLKLRKPPPRLTISPTSARIREAGTTENITRLRLKISEQGVEWTTIEHNGERRDRLVPE